MVIRCYKALIMALGSICIKEVRPYYTLYDEVKVRLSL